MAEATQRSPSALSACIVPARQLSDPQLCDTLSPLWRLLLVPGPWRPFATTGVSTLRSQPLKDLLAAARDSGKVVAAVCVMPAVLASAGVLKGCLATCYPDRSIIGMLTGGGAVYVDQDVVTLGRIAMDLSRHGSSP